VGNTILIIQRLGSVTVTLEKGLGPPWAHLLHRPSRLPYSTIAKHANIQQEFNIPAYLSTYLIWHVQKSIYLLYVLIYVSYTQLDVVVSEFINAAPGYRGQQSRTLSNRRLSDKIAYLSHDLAALRNLLNIA
jgi:hypothetical protein